MACYGPITAYRSKYTNPNGVRPLVFNIRDALDDAVIKLPCGQCIGCRLERSRQWAIRCVHEASLYENNCFITLTFNDEHLPKNKSVDVRDWQLFMKRLRKRFGPKIRFFHCGEYGEKFQRPHYHACLFNFDFPDKKLWSIRRGNKLYTSPSLEQIWPYGFSTIGEVNFETAAYVARYITKKITGNLAPIHYNEINFKTGEILEERNPEYVTMSRRPGIGKPWLDKYMKDVYPSDFVVIKGKKMKPPKFYDRKHEESYPFEHEDIVDKRLRDARKYSSNNTLDRLAVREEVQLERAKKLIRSYEENER